MEGRYQAANGGGEYRGRSGGLTIPAELGDVVTGVFGMDDRPQARTRLRRHAQADPAASFTPVQVAQAYAFPSGTTGNGQTVGIVELGGGFDTSDLTTYFQGLGLSAPSVTAVSVDGGAERAGRRPDERRRRGDAGHRGAGRGRAGGGHRRLLRTQHRSGLHRARSRPRCTSFHHAQAVGGVRELGRVRGARGPQQAPHADGTDPHRGGRGDGRDGDGGRGRQRLQRRGHRQGEQHVELPGLRAPTRLAYGRHLALRAVGVRTIASETRVEHDRAPTGRRRAAGISRRLHDAQLSGAQSASLPVNPVDTQATEARRPGRERRADPQTGYVIRVDGAQETIGGTSAVAPLWAGLTALLNEQLGAAIRIPRSASSCTLAGRRVVRTTSPQAGSNGSYAARTGWDACTGLGSPDGTALAAALSPPGTGTAPAG